MTKLHCVLNVLIILLPWHDTVPANTCPLTPSWSFFFFPSIPTIFVYVCLFFPSCVYFSTMTDQPASDWTSPIGTKKNIESRNLSPDYLSRFLSCISFSFLPSGLSAASIVRAMKINLSLSLSLSPICPANAWKAWKNNQAADLISASFCLCLRWLYVHLPWKICYGVINR